MHSRRSSGDEPRERLSVESPRHHLVHRREERRVAKGADAGDFRKGAAHVRKRETDLADLLRPAEELYTGQQHVRLMRGVADVQSRAADQRKGPGARPSDPVGRLRPRSWLAEARPLRGDVPGHEQGRASQSGLTRSACRGVPRSRRRHLRPRARSCWGTITSTRVALDASVTLGGPTLLFCGKNTLKKLPKLGNLHVVALTNAEAKRFSCGLVALKGELGSRILSRLAADASFGATLAAASDVLSLHRGADAPHRGGARPRCEDGRRLRHFAFSRRGATSRTGTSSATSSPSGMTSSIRTTTSRRTPTPGLGRLVERGLRPSNLSRAELRRDPHLQGRRREEQEEEGAHQPAWRASLPACTTRVPHHGRLRGLRVYRRRGASLHDGRDPRLLHASRLRLRRLHRPPHRHCDRVREEGALRPHRSRTPPSS